MRPCWSSRCITEMDHDELSLEALDEAQYLLERMLDLAKCSASDDCSDGRREDLQKGFELLRGLLDEAAQRYERGRTAE